MVETRMVDDPEFRSEVELTQALRDGLRELQKRGEIAPLLSPRRAIWNRPRVALAASMAAIALGTASFLFFSRQDAAPPGVLEESLHFVQTRSAGPDLAWTRPTAPVRLQLRFDVGLEPAPEYAVEVTRVTDGGVTVVHASLAATADDGEVTMQVDGALFGPGDYELRLTPRPEGVAQPAFTFTLQVSGS